VSFIFTQTANREAIRRKELPIHFLLSWYLAVLSEISNKRSVKLFYLILSFVARQILSHTCWSWNVTRPGNPLLRGKVGAANEIWKKTYRIIKKNRFDQKKQIKSKNKINKFRNIFLLLLPRYITKHGSEYIT